MTTTYDQSRDADVLAAADMMAETLMSQGNNLPAFIESLPLPFRFTAVGTLYHGGYVSETTAMSLIFEPHFVSAEGWEGEGDDFNSVPLSTNEAADMDAIYDEAQSFVSDDPRAEPFVALVLGVAGYDWPRGSGNFHGGTPAAEWTAENYEEAMVGLGLIDAALDAS
jgi:hypothetical protein